MKLITIDFETYYDSKIKLGFKHQTTEEYIRDKRFEVIGVGVKVDDEPTVWVSGGRDKIKEYLTSLDWGSKPLLCHNTLFDGAILNWHYGITPAFMLDTLCMARAIHGVEAGGSLKALADRYEIGVKGEEVIAAEGKARLDFNKEELARYGEYCKNDVDLTLKLFKILHKTFPDDELALIDMTVRMFTHPVFLVDDALLQERYEELKEEKQLLLEGLMEKLNCETAEAVRKKLASNKQFAELLVERGVEAPMKESKTTGKQTYALAKNDEGFLKLTEHDDPFIQQLCAVRLGTKSTIEESRIERFIDVGKRNKGRLPIPLKYYGAHTGRWAGSDKVNFQNLPSRDKKKKALKNAVVAPDDHIVINCDSSQIEARVLVWLAGQDDVVEQFRKGEDVYSLFATKIYDRPITKANPVERFVGKTCILGLGYGTGKLKLQHTLKTTPPGAAVTEAEAEEFVKTYRDTNDKVIDLWGEGDKVIKHLADWPDDSKTGKPIKPYYYGEHRCLGVYKEGIRLPNGLMIRYPELKLNTEESKSRYEYKSRKGPVSLWGGSLVENVVQALARIIVGEQMIKINEKYRVALTVHDAAVIVVPEAEKDEALAYIVECMSTPPTWARGLPVTCEAKYAQTYGEC
jgi:DNA polymerase I-like protein with 3'-5' exonuclease and polymerase domains